MANDAHRGSLDAVVSPIGFPRTNNGHADDGRRLNERSCPNCGSRRFIETVSVEQCPDCGLQCDYWGSGANQVYNTYCERKWAAEEAEAEARRLEEEHDEWD